MDSVKLNDMIKENYTTMVAVRGSLEGFFNAFSSKGQPIVAKVCFVSSEPSLMTAPAYVDMFTRVVTFSATAVTLMYGEVLSNDDMRSAMRGMALHEFAHLWYSSKQMPTIKPLQLSKLVSMVVEDAYIERPVGRAVPRYGSDLRKMRYRLSSDTECKQYEDAFKSMKAVTLKDVLYYFICRKYNPKYVWHIKPVPDTLIEFFDSIDYIDDKEFRFERSMDFAKALFDFFKDQTKKNKQKQQQQQQQGDSGDEGSPTDGDEGEPQTPEYSSADKKKSGGKSDGEDGEEEDTGDGDETGSETEPKDGEDSDGSPEENDSDGRSDEPSVGGDGGDGSDSDQEDRSSDDDDPDGVRGVSDELEDSEQEGEETGEDTDTEGDDSEGSQEDGTDSEEDGDVEDDDEADDSDDDPSTDGDEDVEDDSGTEGEDGSEDTADDQSSEEDRGEVPEDDGQDSLDAGQSSKSDGDESDRSDQGDDVDDQDPAHGAGDGAGGPDELPELTPEEEQALEDELEQAASELIEEKHLSNGDQKQKVDSSAETLEKLKANMLKVLTTVPWYDERMLQTNRYKKLQGDILNQFKRLRFYTSNGVESNLRRGKLDRSMIQYADRRLNIYQKFTNPVRQSDLYVEMLVDFSGSMADCIAEVCEVATAIATGLQVCNFKVGVVFFSSQVVLVKGVEQRVSFDKMMSISHRDNGSYLGGTDLTTALIYVQSVFNSVRNKDKLLVVISDGSPDDPYTAKIAVQNLLKGKVDIVAVGLGDGGGDLEEVFQDADVLSYQDESSSVFGKVAKELTDYMIQKYLKGGK